MSGSFWIFHRDGHVTGQTARRERFVARWEIITSNTIRLSNQGTGQVRYFSTFIDKGEQYIRLSPRAGARQGFEDRIVRIVPIE